MKQTQGVDIGRGGLDTYVVYLPRVMKSVACPVEGCPEKAKNLKIIIDHLMYKHWMSKIAVIQEVPEPLLRCNQCRMHIPAEILWRHRQMYGRDRSMDMRP